MMLRIKWSKIKNRNFVDSSYSLMKLLSKENICLSSLLDLLLRIQNPVQVIISNHLIVYANCTTFHKRSRDGSIWKYFCFLVHSINTDLILYHSYIHYHTKGSCAIHVKQTVHVRQFLNACSFMIPLFWIGRWNWPTCQHWIDLPSSEFDGCQVTLASSKIILRIMITSWRIIDENFFVAILSPGAQVTFEQGASQDEKRFFIFVNGDEESACNKFVLFSPKTVFSSFSLIICLCFGVHGLPLDVSSWFQ